MRKEKGEENEKSGHREVGKLSRFWDTFESGPLSKVHFRKLLQKGGKIAYKSGRSHMQKRPLKMTYAKSKSFMICHAIFSYYFVEKRIGKKRVKKN